jgi:REP element-mobilizing transposase RayT
MQIREQNIYHIYNRGNYKQQIFASEENYLHFLRLMHKQLSPVCDILAWCLMPNHFHFLVYINAHSLTQQTNLPLPMHSFSLRIRHLLSSYTKAINKANKRHGNLFQQRTKSKAIDGTRDKHAEIVFHYIHQNPLKAGLVNKIEDWPYSSFKDYCGLRNGKLCNKELSKQLLDINWNHFFEESYKIIHDSTNLI